MTVVNESIRDRMLADMELANYSERTVAEYLRCCDRFVEHYMRVPDELGETEVRCYFLHLLKMTQRHDGACTSPGLVPSPSPERSNRSGTTARVPLPG